MFTAPKLEPLQENAGTQFARNIFRYWCHIGEIWAIRQILGHDTPEFVDPHDWSYNGP